jgi:hypothetical protein
LRGFFVPSRLTSSGLLLLFIPSGNLKQLPRGRGKPAATIGRQDAGAKQYSPHPQCSKTSHCMVRRIASQSSRGSLLPCKKTNQDDIVYLQNREVVRYAHNAALLLKGGQVGIPG